MQRQQLPVGVKSVVVGVISGEGTARFGPALGAAGRAVVKTLAGSRGKAGEDRLQLGAVVGEVQIHLEVASQRDHRDQIGWLHFRLDKFVRGIHGAVDLFGLHRAEVEEQHHQAAVAGFQGALLRGTQQRALRRNAGGRSIRGARGL